MHCVALAHDQDFEGWRSAARALAAASVAPEEVEWSVGDGPSDLFAGEAESHRPPDAPAGASFTVPRAFIMLAETVIRHDDPERFALLYMLLARLREAPRLLDERADPLVRRIEAMAREARRVTRGSNSAAALAALAEEAAGCTRCPLYRDATHTVFGEGPADAKIMFIGEVPGDQEDLAGRPFVGPAGQVFDRALGEAGIDRARTYVTNAVKHFRFVQRGKRRLHQTPETVHIEACRWWWEQERDIIKPALTVALGGTAARALMGKPVTIGRTRGAPVALPDGGEGWITVHPSYLLRIPEKDRADAEYARFVSDLRAAKTHLAAK